VRFYVKRKLLRTISETETLHEFAGMSGLRAVLDEVDEVKQQLALVQSSLADVTAKLDRIPYVHCVMFYGVLGACMVHTFASTGRDYSQG
jgi:hypothetical protein